MARLARSTFGLLSPTSPRKLVSVITRKAYVKVYARLKNGPVRFFKDGYTDLL